MNDSDSFFGSAKTAENESRPRAVNPQTGREQSWQRASNYAAPLDNPHGLIKWQMRELIKGLSQRPDLARMLLTGAVIDDNAKADEIIAQAHAVAGISAKANEGTAVHAALSRSYLGHEVPSEYMPHVRAFAAELKRNGLTPVATEVRLLCVLLGVIGHADWVVKTADGRYLILDVKTGKLGDSKRKFAVQCKAYSAAEYIDDGKGGWVPIPFAIDQDEAILAHVDPETGATSLYRVDLRLGMYGAVLAEQVRNWHKIEVLSPYVPPHPAIPTMGSALQPAAVANQGRVSREQIGQAFEVPAEVLDDAYGTPNAEQVQATAAAVLDTPGREAFNHLGPDVVNDVRLQTLAADARTPWEHEKAQAEIERRAAAILRTPTEWLHHLGLEYAIKADSEGHWARPMTMTEFLQRYPVPEPVTASDVEHAERNRAALAASVVVGPIEVTEPRPASVVEQVQQSATEAHATAPISPSTDPRVIAAELDDLMHPRNSKPVLQTMAKNLGLTDLAHDRKWLAHWIIATRRGVDNAAATMYAKSKGTMGLGKGNGGSSQVSAPAKASPERVENGVAVRPSTEEERQAGDLSFIFRSIEGAKSVGAIEALRSNVVERRGDQAWTAEMTTAARQRVAELDQAAGVEASPALQALREIAAATEQQHIAAIWQGVTVGGSVPENWTLELREAADARMAQIMAAQSEPPANPYGIRPQA